MTLSRNKVLVGDALEQLQLLPDACVDMVLTSPPYFRLRDYVEPGQLGTEQHIEQWVGQLAAVSAELRRVLLPTGTLWLNLGDTYATHRRQGAGRKSLLLGPERLALQLVQDGWLLRQKIVWHKPNARPTSVRDRLAATWEVVYVFACQPHYFYDLDSIRVPHRSKPPKHPRQTTAGATRSAWLGSNAGSDAGMARLKAEGRVGHPLGANPRDVWTIATSTYRGGHHATFPLTLAERAIRAGSPEARCSRCYAPWGRALNRLGFTATRGDLLPSCNCGTPPEAAMVLDPFMGAGTTAVASEQLGRDWLGIELNPAYAALAEARITDARQQRPTPVAQPPPAA